MCEPHLRNPSQSYRQGCLPKQFFVWLRHGTDKQQPKSNPSNCFFPWSMSMFTVVGEQRMPISCMYPRVKADGTIAFMRTVDGRNPLRTTLKPWETIVCWHLQGNHQKPEFLLAGKIGPQQIYIYIYPHIYIYISALPGSWKTKKDPPKKQKRQKGSQFLGKFLGAVF